MGVSWNVLEINDFSSGIMSSEHFKFFFQLNWIILVEVEKRDFQWKFYGVSVRFLELNDNGWKDKLDLLWFFLFSLISWEKWGHLSMIFIASRMATRKIPIKPLNLQIAHTSAFQIYWKTALIFFHLQQIFQSLIFFNFKLTGEKLLIFNLFNMIQY